MYKKKFITALLFSVSLAACESEPEDPYVTDTAEEILEGEVAPEVPEITDADLERFAQINLIADRKELDPVADRERLLSLIEREGLSNDRYSEVHLAVHREPQLLLRFLEMVDSLRGSDYKQGY